MKFPRPLASLAAAALFAALPLAVQAADSVTDQDKPRQLADAGPVSVSWNDPTQFSELKYSRNRWEAQRGDWVKQLAEYVRKSAGKRLQPGERLEVNIADIKRAGDFEPWHHPGYDHVRVIRDLYPPRMELGYTLYGADGKVLAQGESKLSDLAFMTGSTPINENDPLRYEKRMIDDWTRKLATPEKLASR